MSKHDAYLTCDICGKVVATIKGRLMPRIKAVCGFFNIPRYYSTRVFDSFNTTSREKTVKEGWYICDDCLIRVRREIKSKEMEK